MHLATVPSAETQHQSGCLQTGQGAALETRTQLRFVFTSAKLGVGYQTCSVARPAISRRACLLGWSGRESNPEAGVSSLFGDHATAPHNVTSTNSAPGVLSL